MFLEVIGKGIAGELLGYVVDAVKDSFRQPRMVEAFEKACVSVVKEENDLFNQYSTQALGSTVGIPEEESLKFRLEQAFANNSFPDIEQLTEMLVECWRARKRQLNATEASDFFSLSEGSARPILQKISRNFFIELSKIPELVNPHIIGELHKISTYLHVAATSSAPQPLLSSEELKDATLKASASLFTWPTTLGDRQWMERGEVQTLLDQIEANESSTTILLGPPGSGKSALLAVLGNKLKEKGLAILAIKADKLPSTIDDIAKLSGYLRLPINADRCLRRLAIEQKVILLIDQLDALSELVDRKSERLDVLLGLIQSLSSLKNVHIVSSSRWFEFKHDTRLNTIEAEHLNLAPLSWEQVQAALQGSGVGDQIWSEEAQDLLKVPLHLKIFLDLRGKNTSVDISISLQGFLEALWQERVLNRNGAPDRNTLVHKLAQRMSEDEELWVSRALADSHPEALEDLVRQEILTLDENGLRIGFRHQTYFDFARARYFAQREERLSEYVIARQDGLFIRPILLSSLEYLRGSDLANYISELNALWNCSELRSHLRSLIIEFLSSVESPKDIEIGCLRPLFNDETILPKMLNAMVGSQGWFKILKETLLAELMSKPSTKAAFCTSLLIQALQFDQAAVVDSVRRYWLNDPQYDILTLRVLPYLKVWDEDTVEMACSVARRTAARDISYIAEIISQMNPQLAPRVVRADLDRRFSEATLQDMERSPLTASPADASLDDLSIFNDPGKSRKELLEGNLGWHELSTIAESAPEAFLGQVWPWFVSVLESITHESRPFVVGYRDDHCLGITLAGC